MAELTKKEIKEFVKDIVEKEFKKKRQEIKNIVRSELDTRRLTAKEREEIKSMIRKTIVAQYKYLWEKSSFFINRI